MLQKKKELKRKKKEVGETFWTKMRTHDTF